MTATQAVECVADQTANDDPLSALGWIDEVDMCVLEYRFAADIGWDDPPTATVRPAGATGQPTPCVRIVIFNTPSPANVLTAYPIAC